METLAAASEDSDGAAALGARADRVARAQGFLLAPDAAHAGRPRHLFSDVENAFVPARLRPERGVAHVATRVGAQTRVYRRAAGCADTDAPLPYRFALAWREQIWWRARARRDPPPGPHAFCVAAATGAAAYLGALRPLRAAAAGGDACSVWALPALAAQLPLPAGTYVVQLCFAAAPGGAARACSAFELRGASAAPELLSLARGAPAGAVQLHVLLRARAARNTRGATCAPRLDAVRVVCALAGLASAQHADAAIAAEAAAAVRAPTDAHT